MSTIMASAPDRPCAGLQDVIDDIERRDGSNPEPPEDRFTAVIHALSNHRKRPVLGTWRRYQTDPSAALGLLLLQQIGVVAQVCHCGHEMVPDGKQLVCPKCHTWCDPGVASAATPGDEKDADAERAKEWIGGGRK